MKYIVEFEDEPCMYEDEAKYYKCIQVPWWSLSEKVIKRLTPYQPEPDCVSRKTALDAFGLSEKTRKYGGDHSGYDTRMLYEIQDTLESLPPVQPDHNADISEINKFIDGLEEIFADIRERHVDNSVCGLCEYDGAYMGQSGDWCNECPGFDKDDCFKLSDETRKEWIEEIVNTYPDHTADIGKKVYVDTISRQAALKKLAVYIHLIDKTMGKGLLTDDDCMEAAKSVLGEDELPAVQPATSCSEIPNSSTDCISRQAAIDVALEDVSDKRTHEFNAGAIRAVNRIKSLPSAQPETAKRIVGKSRDGMTLWYQCDMCNEPVHEKDEFCPGCGRRLTDG